MGIRKIENGAAHDRERKDECKKTETKDLMRRKREKSTKTVKTIRKKTGNCFIQIFYSNSVFH